MAATLTGPTIIQGGTAGDNHTVVHLHVLGTDAVQLNNLLFTGLHAGKGAIERVVSYGKHSGVVRLSWVGNANVSAVSFVPSNGADMSFQEVGGLTNPNQAGNTGSIQITSVGQAAGDEFFVTLFMKS